MFARPESFESMDSEASFRLGSRDETLLAVEDGARSTGDTPQAKQEPTKSPMSAISSGGSSLGGPSPDLWKKRGMETSPVSVLFIPELRVNVDTDTGEQYRHLHPLLIPSTSNIQITERPLFVAAAAWKLWRKNLQHME